MGNKIGIGPLKVVKEPLKNIGASRSETQTAQLIHNSFNERISPQKLEEEGQLSVDIYLNEKELTILAPIAGVTSKDIHLSITNNTITIQGTRSHKQKIESSSYLSKECFWGHFSRSIILPESIDVKKIKASFKDGVLQIIIPKKDTIQTRVIKIKP
jgi:HSP20 family protein